MDNTGKGFAAGFIATVVLSILMLMKSSMGLMPQLDPIQMIAHMSHQYMNTSETPAIGWAVHFFIGTILWGGILGAFNHLIPGKTQLAKGILLSIAAWLLMMLMVMPMASAGFFGMTLGIMAPMATLIMHLIFGAVLGYAYAKLMHLPA